MSFSAKLLLDEVEYNVLDCSYSFAQQIDANHKPSNTTQGGQISVLIESRGVINFLQWMIEYKELKDGKLTFFRRDEMSRLYDVKFEKAFCIAYEELFTHNLEQPMQIKMTFSTPSMYIEKNNFINRWAIA